MCTTSVSPSFAVSRHSRLQPFDDRNSERQVAAYRAVETSKAKNCEFKRSLVKCMLLLHFMIVLFSKESVFRQKNRSNVHTECDSRSRQSPRDGQPGNILRLVLLKKIHHLPPVVISQVQINDWDFVKLAMLLQQAMFTSSLNSTKLPLEINPTSPLGTTSSTTSSSPMMDISPLERAFAEERERALAAAAASMAASRKSPPLPPATSASADHNGNDGNKAFPFHPASLAAAFNLRPPPTTVTSVATSNSGNGVLNLSSQKSSPSDLSEVESNGGSYKETDRSSPIKEGKSKILLILVDKLEGCQCTENR